MSTSNSFKINYPSGLGHHVEVCDAQTIEEFANRYFGSVDYKEQGVTVEMTPYPAPEEPAPDPVIAGDDPEPVDAEDEDEDA